MKDLIKKILKEETEEPSDNDLKGLYNEIGWHQIERMFGSVSNYIKMVYDRNLKEFYKNENVRPYYIREGNEVNMYFDDNLVQHLNLEDFNEYEKKLGKFKFGRKNDTQYSIDARLQKVNHVDGKVVWKVVGMSGSSGFGYSFITKRETLAKTYRNQIYQQIIDKYNLEDYY